MPPPRSANRAGLHAPTSLFPVGWRVKDHRVGGDLLRTAVTGLVGERVAGILAKGWALGLLSVAEEPRG